MAAAMTKDDAAKPSLLHRLAQNRTFKLVAWVLNVVVPIAVLALMFVGARDVQQSRAELERTRAGLAEAQAAARKARDEKNEAVAEMQTAVAKRQKIEEETEKLLARQNAVRERNEQMKVEADPQRVIARVRKELGGLTARVRADSLYKQGRDAQEAANLTLAYELYLAARDEDESYLWPHVGLGNIAVLRKNYHVAEKHYTRAVSADPDEPDATLNLASVSAHRSVAKWEQAEKYARRTLQLDPEYEKARTILKQIEPHLKRLKQ